jgi:DNA-binding NtrC family response regulator
MPIRHILVVDDDSLSRAYLVEAVEALGHKCSQAHSGEDGFQSAVGHVPDLVLTDLRMPNVDGLSLVQRLAERMPGLPVVVVTAHGTVEAAVAAMRAGASDFLLKPCTRESLELVIARVSMTQQLRRENRYLRSEMLLGEGALLAESAAMRHALDAARRVARSQGTVLITGECGTGKERLAHFIHTEGSRRNGPFIRVNCALLPGHLLEGELFGYEHGTAQTAHLSREGRMELADGGTLLLDEIGEIPASVQTRLLRVLEDQEFERIGGTLPRRVDVRLIATTNRDLTADITAGRFREDLYYGLHVLPIHLAPLRERPEDIVPLAKLFKDRIAAEHGRAAPEYTPAALERLSKWSWPGNVRELENVVHRAVVLLQGAKIDAPDLLFGPASGAGREEAAPNDRACLLVDRRLEDIEREAILATLASSGGNKTEAARRLGVSARTLSNKMKLWRKIGLVA